MMYTSQFLLDMNLVITLIHVLVKKGSVQTSIISKGLVWKVSSSYERLSLQAQ